MTILEVIEIIESGRIHFIPPDMSVIEYVETMKKVLHDYKTTIDLIRDLPKFHGSITDCKKQIIKECVSSSKDEYMSMDIILDIYLEQNKIITNKKWIKSNDALAALGHDLLTFEEFMELPKDSDCDTKISWITGRTLHKDSWMTVFVEGSNDPLYRRVNYAKKKILEKIQFNPKDKDQETTENDVESCKVCLEEDEIENFVTIRMHRSHFEGFKDWSYRQRKKLKIESTDQTDTLEENTNVRHKNQSKKKKT